MYVTYKHSFSLHMYGDTLIVLFWVYWSWINIGICRILLLLSCYICMYVCVYITSLHISVARIYENTSWLNPSKLSRIEHAYLTLLLGEWQKKSRKGRTKKDSRDWINLPFSWQFATQSLTTEPSLMYFCNKKNTGVNVSLCSFFRALYNGVLNWGKCRMFTF